MAGISHYYDFSRVRSYGARYLMIVGSRGTLTVPTVSSSG